MTISVKSIMNNLSPSYRIRLIAGKNGIDDTNINWVSVVEDYSVEKFKNDNQIILTSVMRYSTDEDLMSLAKNLYKVNAKALIVNIGRYIYSIPIDLKEYCDKINMPLYTIPGDVLMSDVAKDISHILILDEAKELSITEVIQGIIFNTENFQNQINKLSMYGFSEESTYCPIILKFEEYKHDNEFLLRSLRSFFDNEFKNIYNGRILTTFLYNRTITIILADAKKEFIDNFVNALNKKFASEFLNCKAYICIGKLNDNIYNLSNNFKKLLPMLNVSLKNDKNIIYYDDMEIYKILSEVNDIQVLKDIFNKTIGTLIRYDLENYSDLTNYIKSYIYCDGNVQSVSDKFYVHRNTVNNKLKKINEITGIKPISLEGKFLFYIAIKIGELYNL